MVLEYVGTDVVADWLGVGSSTVIMWIAREQGVPEPAAVVRHRRRDEHVWAATQRQEWTQWYESRRRRNVRH